VWGLIEEGDENFKGFVSSYHGNWDCDGDEFHNVEVLWDLV
jgi:hypothetical protein